LSSEREEFTGIERMGAFCDGVFAIALTLLVLELRVPAADIVGREGLWHALGGHWSSYGAFALSFGIIGIMWANHHSLFRYIGRTNHIFSMLNLGLLFFTVLLPFPTAVLATYLPSPEARTPATVLYGANLVMTAIFFNLLWRYAIKGRRLLRAETRVDHVTAEYRLGPILYGAATLLAFVSVWISLGIHALLAAMFLVPNKARP